MRLVTDMVEFCAREMPLWHPISISGYHIREAGSTAAQELAFTLADGFAYLDAAIERGLGVDEFAPRLSFFFNAHIDFFEEIAKYRAARRIWARELRGRYGARTPLMAHAVPCPDRRGVADRPAARGEHRSHRPRGARRSARRHPVAPHEQLRRGARASHGGGGPARSSHPAGDRPRDRGRGHRGPARRLVLPREPHDELERQAYEYFDRIDALGGVVEAIKRNFFQAEIADASFRQQSAVERGDRIVVGVNRYEGEDTGTTELLRIDPESESRQIARVRAMRAERDAPAVEASLARLAADAAGDGNLMAPIVDAARVGVTMGEMCDALREVWGVWRETPVY